MGGIRLGGWDEVGGGGGGRRVALTHILDIPFPVCLCLGVFSSWTHTQVWDWVWEGFLFCFGRGWETSVMDVHLHWHVLGEVRVRSFSGSGFGETAQKKI